MLQVMWIWKTFNVFLFSLTRSNKTYLWPRQSLGSHTDQNPLVFQTLRSQHSFHAFIALFIWNAMWLISHRCNYFMLASLTYFMSQRQFYVIYILIDHIFLQTNDKAQLTDILFPFTCYTIWFLAIGIINTTSKHTHLQDFV